MKQVTFAFLRIFFTCNFGLNWENKRTIINENISRKIQGYVREQEKEKIIERHWHSYFEPKKAAIYELQPHK